MQADTARLEPGSETSATPALPPSVTIQPKLSVNQPGDSYEQEADKIADQVTQAPATSLQRGCDCDAGCAKCQTKQSSQRVQTKHVGSGDAKEFEAPPIVQEVLASGGEPLDAATRGFMESRFGHDFSQVRVHDDTKAAESADAVRAKAYTVGKHVVLGQNQPSPDTTAGRQLLAHELTHVLQQTSSPTLMRKPISDNGPAADSPRMSRAELEKRSNQIYEQAVREYLAAEGKPVTKEMLGILKGDLTVGVLQGVKDGKLVTMVNGHNPKFDKYIQAALKPGEVFVEAISAIPENVRTGEPRKSGHIHVHSEQVLAGEAKVRNVKDAWVATSNKGCDELCVSNLKENYPDVEHVNPKKPEKTGTSKAPAATVKPPTAKEPPPPPKKSVFEPHPAAPKITVDTPPRPSSPATAKPAKAPPTPRVSTQKAKNTDFQTRGKVIYHEGVYEPSPTTMSSPYRVKQALKGEALAQFLPEAMNALQDTMIRHRVASDMLRQ